MSETDAAHDVPELPDIIINDVIEAQDRLICDDSPFNRRAFVRTAFAAIEGVVHIIRRDMLTLSQRHPQTFSRAEMAILSEETYHVDGRGRPKVRAQFMTLTETIRFLAAVAQRHPGMRYAVDLNHVAWENLQTSLKLRHRLTHPKTEADLEVSLDDVQATMSGFLWVLALALRLTEKARNASSLDFQAMVELLRGDGSVD